MVGAHATLAGRDMSAGNIVALMAFLAVMVVLVVSTRRTRSFLRNVARRDDRPEDQDS